MISGTLTKGRSTSLIGEYASLLGDAVLRHRTREAEHAARIEAELASRVKSEFISNMSHELRTPLNTVMGFSKLLSEHGQRKLPAEEIVEYAQLIHNAASHLLAVINDILDMSKMQSGRYTLDAREINLEEVLQASVELFRAQAGEARTVLDCRIAADLPLVRGDAGKLRQVFSNIISNAIKFSHPGGQIDIEARRLSDGGVLVVVRDTGVGMTSEELEIALTPFGQVDGGRSRWREGTGLGLPIAKALIELHGGRIEVRTEKGKGTEVAILLPSRHQVSVTEGRDALLGQGRLT
jgi:two-component system cell cycle sensor histidine kinase PleC